MGNRHNPNFQRIHQYIFDGLLLASFAIAAIVIVVWDIHGAVSFIRWIYAR